MNQVLLTTGMLIGGLGLFILAVSMITDGLKLAAGNALRNLLAQWTRTLPHGIGTGFAITSVVQSSSAVTVATIGFVNAGLISLKQALGVIFGSNIGTTMTGWLVALVGFKIKVELFALPLIGIGMLLRLAGSDTRRAPIGIALAGFGLFFIGIDVLKEAFEGMAATIDLHKFTMDGIAGLLLFVAIGFMITVLTQSSSASIAITLTAAAGGVVGLNAAAAMVIGANVGTTSTAAIAVIGATPNAKRVAAAHIMFNVMTGLVAILLLPVLFWVVRTTGKILGLADLPVVTLALFHTVFNVLGVLLIWPLTGRLTAFLESRFVSLEEIEARPRYLDKTVAVSPMLALSALTMELSRIAGIARRMAMAALSAETGPGKRIGRDRNIAEKLARSVDEFITHQGKDVMTGDAARQLSLLLRAEQHLLACARMAHEVTRAQAGLKYIEDEQVAESIASFRSEVVRLMEMASPEDEGFSFAACESQLGNVQKAYERAKSTLLDAGAELRIPIPDMIDALDQNSRNRRMARQMVKAMHYLSDEMLAVSENRVHEAAEDAV